MDGWLNRWPIRMARTRKSSPLHCCIELQVKLPDQAMGVRFHGFLLDIPGV